MILSTLAMLLLSGASSAVDVTFVAVSALALGLLVAMTVPRPAPRRPVAVGRPAGAERSVAPEPVRAAAPPAREPVRERAAS